MQPLSSVASSKAIHAVVKSFTGLNAEIALVLMKGLGLTVRWLKQSLVAKNLHARAEDTARAGQQVGLPSYILKKRDEAHEKRGAANGVVMCRRLLIVRERIAFATDCHAIGWVVGVCQQGINLVTYAVEALSCQRRC